jgi:xylono-1,5-lactonase
MSRAGLAQRRPVSVCEVGAELGEGPVWVERDQAVWFTDIKRRHVHRFDPASGDHRCWKAPAPPGFVLPLAGGGLIAGLKTGLHRFDENDGSFRLIATVEPDRPGNRLNDATVDVHGRLWFGSMDDAERDATGAVYLVSEDGSIRRAWGDCTIVNGPAVAPDGRRLYFIDTLGGTVYVGDMDGDGVPGEPEVFCRIDPADGFPDGPSIDADGCVWIGLYGGWCARRYAPAGELIDEIRFPVANVTKIAFGGADRRTAFATTARKGLDSVELQRQPQAGNLFAFRVGTPGAAAHEVRVPPVRRA